MEDERNLVGCIRNDIKQRQQSNLASVVNNSCDAKAFTYSIDISDLPLVVNRPLLKRRNISEELIKYSLKPMGCLFNDVKHILEKKLSS